MASQNLRPNEQSMVAGLPELLTLSKLLLKWDSYLFHTQEKEVLVHAQYQRVGEAK
jgi:hypothetical protein